jgi:hypothetical protein
MSDFLTKKSGKEGNHWMEYHIIMIYVRVRGEIGNKDLIDS